jgi:hypothetical protein
MSESSASSLNESSTPYAATDLEFPDFSGHLPHRSNVPLDQWLAHGRSNLPRLRHGRSNLPRLRQRPGYREARLQDGIAVEFVL